MEQPVSDELPKDDEQEETEGDEQHDILGEMEIADRLTITGGEAKEDARLTRPDRAMIRRPVFSAVEKCYQEKRQTLIPK